MTSTLKTKVGSIFCDELDIKNGSVPCTCEAEDRTIFIASTKSSVNLKKDKVMYWCSCGSAGLLNNTERKNSVIYPVARLAAGIRHTTL